MNKFFLIIGLVLTFSQINAQKTLSEGTVEMEVTEIKTDDPALGAQMEMMKGSLIKMYFTTDKYLSHMSMMGGMVDMKSYVSQKEDKMNLLFDMMGQKIWIESGLAESVSAEQKEAAEKVKVTYDKNDKKEIQGYSCYRMNLENPETPAMAVKAYITEDIKSKANIIRGYETIEFAGFPLEFTVGNEAFSMTTTAKSIKDSVDQALLTPNTAGYKKMTMTEFQEMMGGFGM